MAQMWYDVTNTNHSTFRRKIKMEALGRISFLVILLIVGTFSDGYTFSKGWEWFVSDIFGVMKLTILQGVGLAMFIRYITTRVKTKDLEESDSDGFEKLVKLFFVAQVINVFFLVIGYILKGLM